MKRVKVMCRWLMKIGSLWPKFWLSDDLNLETFIQLEQKPQIIKEWQNAKIRRHFERPRPDSCRRYF